MLTLTHAPRSELPLSDRLLLILACVVFTICFCTGGSSQESGIGLVVAQLLAIPVLLYAVLLGRERHCLASVRWSIAALVLIAALPALQLVPVPQAFWNLSAPRQALRNDLAAVGVTSIKYHWTLTPAATERALLSLLPAAALFFTGLVLTPPALRKLLALFIALALLSLMLAIAQLGAGQASWLNPYPQYLPAMTGVFANRNHQADALAVALVLSLGMMLDARRRYRRKGGSNLQVWVFGTLVVLFALALPLVGSRAGVIVAMIASAALMLASRSISLERARNHWPTRIGLVAAIVVFAAGFASAIVWMQTDVVDSLGGTRWMLAKQTTMLALANLPVGGGVGSFVPLFEQETGNAWLQQTYVNHAHDEYVQWFLEGGALAVVCGFAVLVVLIVAWRRSMRLHRDAKLRIPALAALIAIAAELLHSIVDYPLRTPALMATCGMLAGIAVASRGASGLRPAAARETASGDKQP